MLKPLLIPVFTALVLFSLTLFGNKQEGTPLVKAMDKVMQADAGSLFIFNYQNSSKFSFRSFPESAKNNINAETLVISNLQQKPTLGRPYFFHARKNSEKRFTAAERHYSQPDKNILCLKSFPIKRKIPHFNSEATTRYDFNH